MRGGLGTALGGLLAPLAAVSLPGCATMGQGGLLGFKGIPVSVADKITVPEGYMAQVIAAWGEPVGLSGELPAFKEDASNTAAEQMAQMGMHHDGIHFFPTDGSKAGLLVMNHEYADDGLLHTDGNKTWSAEKVRKAQAAHGVSVIEIEQKDGKWDMVRPSPFARRFTASTPMMVSGPAAGHAMMKTAADPTGTRVLGTLEQLRQRHYPLGHLPHLRRKLHFLLQRPRHPQPTRGPLGPAKRRPHRLPLARA